MAPEDQGTTFILSISKNFMELNRESIEVADMKRAKVGMEGIVQ